MLKDKKKENDKLDHSENLENIKEGWNILGVALHFRDGSYGWSTFEQVEGITFKEEDRHIICIHEESQRKQLCFPR